MFFYNTDMDEETSWTINSWFKVTDTTEDLNQKQRGKREHRNIKITKTTAFCSRETKEVLA